MTVVLALKIGWRLPSHIILIVNSMIFFHYVSFTSWLLCILAIILCVCARQKYNSVTKIKTLKSTKKIQSNDFKCLFIFLYFLVLSFNKNTLIRTNLTLKFNIYFTANDETN